LDGVVELVAGWLSSLEAQPANNRLPATQTNSVIFTR
jgi:hypothetical protein